jgi:hypothetical protein
MDALAVHPQVANDESAVANRHAAPLLIVRNLRQKALARPEVTGADVDENGRTAAGHETTGEQECDRQWGRASDAGEHVHWHR